MSDSPTPPDAGEPPRQGWLDIQVWLLDEWILVLHSTVALRVGVCHWADRASAIGRNCALLDAC